MIIYSNDENNFPCELLLTNRRVSNICKAFVNNSSSRKFFSKSQIYKVVQSGGFLIVGY